MDAPVYHLKFLRGRVSMGLQHRELLVCRGFAGSPRSALGSDRFECSAFVVPQYGAVIPNPRLLSELRTCRTQLP
eukprot:6524517-Pyramimonas_sp.AAC.1